MAEGEGATHSAGKGIKGFLMGQTGPLPNWAWLLVVGGGLAAVYFVPKLLGKSSANQPDQTTTNAGTGNSGLGLAVDPTTGLPYAVEGLVPSGGVVGTQPGQLPPIPPPAPVPVPPTYVPPTGTGPPIPVPPRALTPGTLFKGPSGVTHYIATGDETLGQIATKLGVGTWNSIYGIPENQELFGAMNYATARTYKPKAGEAITVPGSAKLGGMQPTETTPVWPGGTTQQRIA